MIMAILNGYQLKYSDDEDDEHKVSLGVDGRLDGQTCPKGSNVKV